MTSYDPPVVLRGEKCTNEDGSITISFTVSAEAVEEFESQLSSDGDDLVSSNYCCTCGSGGSTTISASNWFSAASKCLGRCSGSFGLGRGSC